MFTTFSLLLTAACLVPAAGKLTGHPRMRASAAHFGIAWQRYQLIGMAELAAAAGVVAGLYWHPIGLIAGVCLAFLLLGATVTHLRASDSWREVAPAILVLAIDVVYLTVALTG